MTGCYATNTASRLFILNHLQLICNNNRIVFLYIFSWFSLFLEPESCELFNGSEMMLILPF